MKKVNYHTHTSYCRHASGEVLDYVKEAVDKELEILGFSDHIPFPGNKYDFRMLLDEKDYYLNDIENAKKEVQNTIKIYTGFEAEYISEHHKFYEKIQEECDYLILGQHMIGNGMEIRLNTGELSSTEWYLLYVNEIIEGMHTQFFKAVAHPDIMFMNNYAWDYYCEKACDLLIEDAIKNRYVLEYNANGYRRGTKVFLDGVRYQYPHAKFWELVGKTNIPVIISSDCHNPKQLYDSYVALAYEDARKHGLNIVTEIFS